MNGMPEADFSFACCTLVGISVFILEGLRYTLWNFAYAGGIIRVYNNGSV